MARFTTRLQIMVTPGQDELLVKVAAAAGVSKAIAARYFLPSVEVADDRDWFAKTVLELREASDAELEATIEEAT